MYQKHMVEAAPSLHLLRQQTEAVNKSHNKGRRLSHRQAPHVVNCEVSQGER